MNEKLQNLLALSRKLFKEHKRDGAEYKAALEEILKLCEKDATLKNERFYALYYLARFYSNKFKFDLARELYLTLIDDPASLKCGDEFVNYGLGAIDSLAYDFRIAKNYAEAIKFYKLLLRVSGDLGAISQEALAFENIAFCYEKSGDFDAAVRTLKNIFDAFDVARNGEFYINIKMKIAKAHFGAGEFDLAAQSAFALLEGFDTGDASLDYARINALCLIGESYIKQRNFSEARRMFIAMTELARTDKYFKTDENKAAKFLKICDEGEGKI